MKELYDIVVIGAGSGGLVAAATAVGMGANVLLIENHKMGGDCLNYGCVPSKTFLHSTHLAKKISDSSKYGIKTENVTTCLQDIMDRVKRIIKEIEPHDSKERFEKLGVDVLFGHCTINSNKEVEVDGKKYATKKILIATGSTAFIPPIEGLENVEYYTNENIFDLKVLPKRMVVLGGGPIGLELGQGFAHLGSKVTIVDRGQKLFSKEEPMVSKIMTEQFFSDGMELCLNSQVEYIKKSGDEIELTLKKSDKKEIIKCDVLLVATGRKPNSNKLGLEKVGVKIDNRGFIKVDEKMRTSIKNIYACGDICGGYLFTHTASYEAGIAVKNALIANIFKSNYYNISWTTYTMPEVAHVGMLKAQAEAEGKFGDEIIIAIDNNDRAKADDDRKGFLQVVIDKKGIVIGATVVSEKAGDLLVPLSMMVTSKQKLSSAMSIIYQYPIQGEIVKAVAVENFKVNVKEWQRTLLKKIIKVKK